MADVKEVLVPDIGDYADVPVIEVLVAVGDVVEAEAPLVTLESDKASMDVPAPFAGTVASLAVAVGDKVSEGMVLLTLGEPSGAEGDAAGDDPPAAEPEVAQAVEAEAASEPAPATDTAEAPAKAQAPAKAEAPAKAQAPSGDAPPHASPAVRRAARQKGIDLSGVTGTGRNGRITLADLDAPAATPAAATTSGDGDGDGGLGLAPWPKVDFAKHGEIERVPLTRIQKISGPNLARNWVRIPHVTHHEDADVTELEAFRKQVNGEQADVKVTMVALLMKACVASLQAFPVLNSSLDGDDLVLKKYVHLGFAADTPGGLVVPVIRDVDRKGLLAIAGELSALSAKARAGKLMPADMSGGTFTISSLGGIGGTGFTPIVNAPEVAILGVTRSAMRPVWDGAQFVPRLIVPLSLSYDHRVVDGALAARFCAHLAAGLSDLRRVLL